MSINATVKIIQDIMRKDAGLDGDAQRIAQLVWMIFLKIFDACERKYESIDNNYKSPIPEPLRWRNWAVNPERKQEECLVNFINEDLLKSLKKLSNSPDPTAQMIGRVFEDTHNYMKNSSLICQVITKLNEFKFENTEEKNKFGEIYEKILKDLQSAGNAGEFYTPRAVTQFIVDRIKPSLGETILDPACGTGGFLTATIDYLTQNANNKNISTILQNTVFGIEKKALPYHLCVTNLLLHDIKIPAIEHRNALAKSWKTISAKDKVDVLITNPPFGGTEEDGIEGYFREPYQTRETAYLFLNRIIDLLKDNGRAAIVLPDGVLSGEGVKMRIRERLLSECNLHTVVRLPSGVFNPYTNINTNLLFFTKGEPTTVTWYFEHPYPKGYKSYSKTKPIKFEEFSLEKEWWKNRKVDSLAWKVSLSDLKETDYSLDFKNPYVHKKEYKDTNDILQEYKIIKKEFNELKSTLKQALLESLKD